MNKMVKYKNRYGDIHTFEVNERGNIDWKGNFDHCRVGYNDNPDDIIMVDPSGGPFIAKGMKSSLVHEDVKGKFVKEFIQKDDGWIIVLQE